MEPFIINRGINFEITYKMYAPRADNPKAPDYNSPIDLTGLTVKFCIESETGKIIFTNTITVTPLQGRVDVTLSASQTTSLPLLPQANAYIELTDGSGNVYRRGARRCVVVS